MVKITNNNVAVTSGIAIDANGVTYSSLDRVDIHANANGDIVSYQVGTQVILAQGSNPAASTNVARIQLGRLTNGGGFSSHLSS